MAVKGKLRDRVREVWSRDASEGNQSQSVEEKKMSKIISL